MKRTWKPTAAGIINIVVGIFTVFAVFVGAVVLVGAGGGFLAMSRAYQTIPVWLSGFLQGMSIIVAIFIIAASAVPIIGGVYSLQRRNWGWALAGSIIALLGTSVPGIVSTVLTAMSRDEFIKEDRFR